MRNLGENGWIDKPTVDVADAELVFRDDRLNVSIAIEAGSFDEALDLTRRLLNQLEISRDRYNDISKIAKHRTVAVSEQVAMPKYQERSAIRVKADGNMLTGELARQFQAGSPQEFQ
jgi:hypothetical protein